MQHKEKNLKIKTTLIHASGFFFVISGVGGFSCRAKYIV
jgi:hypothetical protein